MQSILFQTQTITPSKVVCIGRNYVAHIEELGNKIPENMVLFFKPNSAITDTLCYFTPQTRFEAEISFVVQNGAFAGIGVGFDLTHADIQNRLKQKGLPWERAKGFDKSAVFSEFVPIESFRSLRLDLFINGTLTQSATDTLMIYKPHTILEEIKTFCTLEDGDIIMCGTPKGVGNYKIGDVFETKLYVDEKLMLEKKWEVI